VSDLLLGTPHAEFSDAPTMRQIPEYDACVALYGQHGGDFHSLERMGADFCSALKAGIAQALNNGLDDAENRELISSTDAQRIARLVLTGLRRLRPP
jgi:hypothetical protein